jgi:hypothetical protein
MKKRQTSKYAKPAGNQISLSTESDELTPKTRKHLESRARTRRFRILGKEIYEALLAPRQPVVRDEPCFKEYQTNWHRE